MSDHYHYEYAEARHDHRGEYADDRHDHDLEYAEKHHRHYDDEREVEGLRHEIRGLREDLRRELRALREDLASALGRIRLLEHQTPQARRLQLEADQAAADLAESGFGDDYDPELDDEAAPVTCMRTIWIDGRLEQCGEPVDHEPTAECPGNPHARPAPEASQP